MTNDPVTSMADSKTRRKHKAQELQKLGARLLEMPESLLNKLPLSTAVSAAVAVGRRITSHGARKRQMLYIGKLLRSEETSPLILAIEQLESAAKRETHRFHRLEQWRDYLVDQGDPALARLCQAHPDADRQRLRQLVRRAQRESQLAKPPAAARRLFKLLLVMDRSSPLPAIGD